MQNKYLSIEEYKKYIEIFELSPDDVKKLDNVIKKVSNIIELQDETVMINKEERYLRFLMLPSDYAKINKDLNKQREFKFRREVEKFKEYLENENNYTNEEKKEKLEEFKEKLFSELKLKYSTSAEEGTTMTLENLEEMEEK